MLKLINFSVHPSDLDKFAGDYNQIRQFLKKHELQGLEIIQHSRWDAGIIPPSMIVGLHTRFWPIGPEVGKEERAAFIKLYRSELKAACDMDAAYVVFPVGHVRPEHCYNYRFTYDDQAVAASFIAMINEILEGMDASFDLLLENLWWPGLTLLDKDIAAGLMEGIKYPNKGFMLDTGHLMNTNRELTTEAEAADYILETLEALEELSVYIQGIHLNSSLSGEYVKKEILRCSGEFPEEPRHNSYRKVSDHISKIDRHVPFTHPSVKRIIEFIKPQYLVYEFVTTSLEELDVYVKMQNGALRP